MGPRGAKEGRPSGRCPLVLVSGCSPVRRTAGGSAGSREPKGCTVTKDKDFKDVVRERAQKTGESYAAARAKLTEQNVTYDLARLRDDLAASYRTYWAGFRPGLRGLSNDEYRWQPVPGCPTIHEQSDGTYTC